MTAANILSYISFGTISPYLSLLVRGLGYAPLHVGILLGIFEGAGIAGPFAFGYFADKTRNYRGGIIITYAATALAVIPLVMFVHPLISALALVVFAFALRSTAPLLDALTTLSIGKSGNYGRIRAMGSLSFVVMVLLLQFTPVLKPDTPGHIAFWIVSTTLAAIIPLLFTGSRKFSKGEVPGRLGAEGRKTGGGTPMWTGTFAAGLLIMFFCRFAMSPVYTFFPLFLTETMNWPVVGAMSALATAAEVPVMYFSARILRRHNPLPLLALSTAAVGVRLGIYALFPVKAWLIGAQMLHALCFGLFHPAAVAFITFSVPPERRALGMTFYLSLGSGLPSLLGNMLGGAIAHDGNYQRVFAVFTLFAAAGVAVYLLHKKNLRTGVS
jgi:PPP family 3-phenylpropionic acid transporter